MKQKTKTKRRWLSGFLRVFLCLAIFGISTLVVINSIVKGSTNARILTSAQASQLEDVDCILVLGCYVHENGRPSDMLNDRLTRGVELYDLGAAPKLLMSGDHGRETYNEVDAMKQFAVDKGIESQDVFMDHAGFSTYESIYRVRDVFHADKIIIVTQKYHLYRALYIAKQLGVEAYGVAADYHTYVGQTARDVREVLARVKDWAICIVKPLPTFLGEPVPVSGNGDLTNDETSDFS